MKGEDRSRVEGIKGSKVQESASSGPLTLQPFNPATRSSKVVHRLAAVNAWATFALLLIGGLVTSKGVGLAVPDWPTTFGYQMFLYPWSKMVGGIFYEHSHRLVASGVGLLTLILAVALWFRERRRWLCWLGTLALVLVIVQGVIGGLRVLLLKETLAILHACLAQAFFALAVGLAFFTSREWQERPEEIRSPDASWVRRLCVLTTGMVYVQGILGAVLRHTGTGLEVHLLLALLVALHVLFLAARIAGQHADQPKLLRPALHLRRLLMLQLVLGLGSFLGKFTSLGMIFSLGVLEALTTAHLLAGALMLVASLVLALRSYRILAPAPLVTRRVFSEQTPA